MQVNEAPMGNFLSRNRVPHGITSFAMVFSIRICRESQLITDKLRNVSRTNNPCIDDLDELTTFNLI